MYLTLDDRRLAYWERWTEQESFGQIVRHAERDTARERAALVRRREEIAERMGGENNLPVMLDRHLPVL